MLQQSFYSTTESFSVHFANFVSSKTIILSIPIDEQLTCALNYEDLTKYFLVFKSDLVVNWKSFATEPNTLTSTTLIIGLERKYKMLIAQSSQSRVKPPKAQQRIDWPSNRGVRHSRLFVGEILKSANWLLTRDHHYCDGSKLQQFILGVLLSLLYSNINKLLIGSFIV